MYEESRRRSSSHRRGKVQLVEQDTTSSGARLPIRRDGDRRPCPLFLLPRAHQQPHSLPLFYVRSPSFSLSVLLFLSLSLPSLCCVSTLNPFHLHLRCRASGRPTPPPTARLCLRSSVSRAKKTDRLYKRASTRLALFYCRRPLDLLR